MNTDKLRDMNLHAVSDELEQLRAFKAENDRLRAKLAAMESELSSLPAKWSEDSSLETWFPLTSDEMESLREEVSELRAYKEAAEWQRPDCWRITHRSFCGIVTDKKEIAEDPFYSGCVFPLYAKPVPAEQPVGRITEQDARDIATSYCHWKSEGFYNAWFAEKGRDLLNRLNADREQLPAVAVPVCVIEAIDWLKASVECANFPWDDDPLEAAKRALDASLKYLAAAPSHSQQSAE